MFSLGDLDLKTIVSIVASVAGTYAAIRADIKNIYSRFSTIEKDIARVEHSSTRSHERIDSHITDFHRK